MRRPLWQLYETKLSSHPYRDSLVIYAVLGGIVVAIAAATGGSIVKAVIVGVAFFAAATLYSWWRVRERLRRGKEDG